jgi:glycosyltransferase involved in cell wall biosynthesis
MTARVLFVVENLSVPSDRRVWAEACTIAALGNEVTVVCPKGTDRDLEDRVTLHGIEIHRFEPRLATGGAASYVREYLAAGASIVKLVRGLSRPRAFDVIHVANPPDFLVPLITLTYARGARIVFDQHDVTPELFLTRFGPRRRLLLAAVRTFEWLSYRLATVVIVTNDSFRALAESRGGQRSSDVFVVRNAPDLRSLERPEPDPDLRRGKAHLIVYAGVMGPQDGVERAVEALARLGERRDDWHAVFAGDGECLPGLRSLVSALGLGEQVEFAGWLTGADLAQLLATADICVAPEPSSPINDVSTLVKIAEYMAAGKPVVCQDLRESRVTAGDAAMYADDGPTSYAAALDALLADASLRRRMGDAARERIASHLTWEHSERQLVDAYARLAKAR